MFTRDHFLSASDSGTSQAREELVELGAQRKAEWAASSFARRSGSEAAETETELRLARTATRETPKDVKSEPELNWIT